MPTNPNTQPIIQNQPVTISLLTFFVGLIISTAVIVTAVLTGFHNLEKTVIAMNDDQVKTNAVQDEQRESDRRDILRVQVDVADLRRSKQDKPYKFNATL
jgi:predicted PurR-regulated permease PerM